MRRFKECWIYVFAVTLISNDVTAWLIESDDFYYTDTLHITDDAYDNWNEYNYWKSKETWASSRRSVVYRNQGRAFRPRPNREYSTTVEFEDYGLWIYDPPRRQSSAIPVEYEVCLDKIHDTGSETICYQFNTAEDDYKFQAKDSIRYREHRTVEHLADATEELDDTTNLTEQSAQEAESPQETESPPTRCRPYPAQPPSSIRPSKSLPLSPRPRSAQRLRPDPIRRPVYKRPSSPKLPIIGWFVLWFYLALVVIRVAGWLRAEFIQMRSRQRERERLLASLRTPRVRFERTRPHNEPATTPSALSSTEPLLFHTPPDDWAVSPSSDTSDTFTIPPSYEDALREQEEDFL